MGISQQKRECWQVCISHNAESTFVIIASNFWQLQLCGEKLSKATWTFSLGRNVVWGLLGLIFFLPAFVWLSNILIFSIVLLLSAYCMHTTFQIIYYLFCIHFIQLQTIYCIYIYIYIYIQTWSELFAPFLNMIKEGCGNKCPLLILLIFYFKKS